VETTAAAKDNSLLLAGDATASSNESPQIAAVDFTEGNYHCTKRPKSVRDA
jgi:hypothetical protein